MNPQIFGGSPDLEVREQNTKNRHKDINATWKMKKLCAYLAHFRGTNYWGGRVREIPKKSPFKNLAPFPADDVDLQHNSLVASGTLS